MKENQIASDVRRFIYDNIHSVEQLEVLLLLRREPHRDWSAGEVSAQLLTVADSVALRLRDLQELRLLRRSDAGGWGSEPRYCYAPTAPSDEETIARLAQLYRERKDAVIQVIFSRPPIRVNSF